MAETAKWYVVHTYSGYENTVKATIEKNVETRHMQDRIHEVAIPMETVSEMVEKVRKPKKGESDQQPRIEREMKTYERKIFPGYVLVKMILSDEAWYVVNNVRGVTGFVGSGTKPIPLTEEEVLQLGVEKREIVVGYEEGDRVRINDGPLINVVGVVDALEVEKNKVRVIVSMFGRETPVELELDQVERATD